MRHTESQGDRENQKLCPAFFEANEHPKLCSFLTIHRKFRRYSFEIPISSGGCPDYEIALMPGMPGGGRPTLERLINISATSSFSVGQTSRTQQRPSQQEVLANGIDPAEVGDAIQAGRPSGGAQQASDAQQAGGPRRGGRPHGPPPPPRSSDDSEEETSAVESALLSANVAEADIDELIAQMIETISELSADGSSDVSSNSIRSALTDVLNENGVDVERFEQALQGELGSSGSFFNRVA